MAFVLSKQQLNGSGNSAHQTLHGPELQGPRVVAMQAALETVKAHWKPAAEEQLKGSTLAERKDTSTGAVYGSEEFSAKQEELKSAEQGKETLCKDTVGREKDLFSGRLILICPSQQVWDAFLL